MVVGYRFTKCTLSVVLLCSAFSVFQTMLFTVYIYMHNTRACQLSKQQQINIRKRDVCAILLSGQSRRQILSLDREEAGWGEIACSFIEIY